MKKDIINFTPLGMNKDISPNRMPNTNYFDARNIRLSANDNNTMFSLSNERGTKAVVEELSIEGTYLGHCVLNNYITIFTKSDTLDYIHLLENSGNNTFAHKILYSGNLNFSIQHPIETLGSYENDLVQKVYWVDGLNQPRVINIAAAFSIVESWDSNSFDFNKTLKLQETINVTRVTSSNGSFPSGVIQYCFSYYDLYGGESNLFDVSDLLYTSLDSRGGSPEEDTSCAFNISIANIDKSFDYLRIYSIFRTSIDATPTTRRVVDIPLKNATNSITYKDTGRSGDVIDPTELLFIGGEDLVAGTLTSKDNTLFLGNIKSQRLSLNNNIKDTFKTFAPNFVEKVTPFRNREGFYNYSPSLQYSSRQIKTFKYLEWYRFGVQVQYHTGKWSEPIWIQDLQNNKSVGTSGLDPYSDTTLTKATLTIPKTLSDQLKTLGYKKIRPIVVYPELADRECLCQGVLNPTLYNTEDRETNSPTVQSSWFFRPLPSDATNSSLINTNPNDNNGSILEYRHLASLPNMSVKNAEIQCASNTISGVIDEAISEDTRKYIVAESANNYYVDHSICTLHSPDIEFDDSLLSLDLSNAKLRIVGIVPINSFNSDIDIQTSTPANNYTNNSKLAPGFTKFPISSKDAGSRWRALCGGIYWMDNLTDPKDTTDDTNFSGFMIYPWHRDGSLNNTTVATEGYKSATLKHKKLSNLRFSSNSIYTTPGSVWSNSTLSGVGIFDSNEIEVLKLGRQHESLDDIFYYGNVDKVITPSINGYAITIATSTEPSDPNKVTEFMRPYDAFNSSYLTPLTDTYSKQYECFDPVRIKYKSTRHGVVSFEFTSDSKMSILPAMQNTVTNVAEGLTGIPIWDKNKIVKGYYQNKLNIGSSVPYVDGGFLWLGELYNDTVINRFGGTSSEALANNLWVPCGTSKYLEDVTTIEWEEGDTYYQRYDHLKTYPYTSEDTNSVIDILSFMCETRVNIDGRYDRNVGLPSNLYINNTNFNLINPVYSQRNSFFNYRILDDNLFNINTYPNTIVWSLEKQNVSVVDTWTNITLASVLNLDGDKGSIESLNTFNNEIYCFQDRGVSNILFNSRIQIPTSDGVPIEISNNYKVQGKRYIGNVGCDNKWSISESNRGIYFIDTLSNSLMLLSGSLDNISDRLGFSQWFKDASKNTTDWNAVDYNNTTTHYDYKNKELFIINKDECLCYSELLQQFTSFYNYEKVPALFNINNTLCSYHNNTVWGHYLGDYCNFYGKDFPYSITFIGNKNTTEDKIFTNIEYNSNSYTDENIPMSFDTFDKLEIWNDYQHNLSILDFQLGVRSNLKKKFNIWRIDIPRASSNNRDRIRSPWVYFKLSKLGNINSRMEVGNINLYYYTL